MEYSGRMGPDEAEALEAVAEVLDTTTLDEDVVMAAVAKWQTQLNLIVIACRMIARADMISPLRRYKDL